MPLLPWQEPILREMQAKIAKRNTLVLAASTGVGKTYLTAQLCAEEKRRAFVICPKSVLSSWSTVLDEYGCEYYDILNWEKLKTGKTQWWKKDRGWCLPSDANIVFDEAHKQCSGEDSQSGTMMASLKGRPAMLVSATMAASPLQMRHSGYLLGLHGWDQASWTQWKVANGCYFDREYRYWRPPSHRKGREVMAAINASLSDVIVYRRHSEIPGFPECDTQAKLYNLGARDTSEIRKAYQDMSDRMKKVGASDLAEANKARERTELLKCGLFVELIEEALEQDMSPVVFLNYREPLFRLRDMLRDNGITNVSMVYGGQNTEARDANIAAFQSNASRVCLVITASGGAGISLHAVHGVCPRISYISPSYNASDVRQALGRIHRVGGMKAIQRFVLAAGTVEEKVYANITAKLGNIDALNDSDLTI